MFTEHAREPRGYRRIYVLELGCNKVDAFLVFTVRWRTACSALRITPRISDAPMP
jgi:hypothetical protein